MSEHDSRRVVPSIEIRERPGESMRVPVRGQGLVFGSVLEVGDIEVMGFYDYPGGILTSIDRTQVLRTVNLCGRQCFEVLKTTDASDPPEPPELNYFEVRDQDVRWLLRIRAGEVYPDVRPEVITEMTTPRWCNSDQQHTRVVDLRVGETDRGRCLVVLLIDDDGTAAEDFHQPDGRVVLHRRYVGPDAGYGDYEHLPADPMRMINDKPYRQWYDTVLLEP